MFETWYCLCAENEGCPRRDTCLRAAEHPAGIYTMSMFWVNGQCIDDSYIPIPAKEEEKK